MASCAETLKEYAVPGIAEIWDKKSRRNISLHNVYLDLKFDIDKLLVLIYAPGMGVVCVLSYAVPEGRTVQQTVDLIQKRLEQLSAERAGNFSVDCDTYQSQQLPHRHVHTLHNSDQPASCFSVLDTGTSLVADLLFDVVLQKMKQFYLPRRNLKVEARGLRYTLGGDSGGGMGGDFVVKVGSVILGQTTSFKGVLVEVEYLPCVVPADCWPLLKECILGLLGPSGVNVDTPSQHFRGMLDSGLVQGPSDVVLQYLEHFNNYRKAVSQSQQQR